MLVLHHNRWFRFFTRIFFSTLTILIFSSSIAQANPYLAKPGEAPIRLRIATCAVSGGFVQPLTFHRSRLTAHSSRPIIRTPKIKQSLQSRLS